MGTFNDGADKDRSSGVGAAVKLIALGAFVSCLAFAAVLLVNDYDLEAALLATVGFSTIGCIFARQIISMVQSDPQPPEVGGGNSDDADKLLDKLSDLLDRRDNAQNGNQQDPES
jgi:hypothetical protein